MTMMIFYIDQYYEDDNEDYNYLVKMPMDSVTEENIEKLLNEKGKKETELEIVKTTSNNKMWLNELYKVEELYLAYKDERSRLMYGEEIKKKKVVSKGGLIKKTTKKTALLVEDDV